jgi:iron complex outermembrane receptor protein
VDLEMTHTTGNPGLWRLVFGASLRRDTVRSGLYLGDEDDRKNMLRRQFASLEVRPFPRLTLNAGVMREDNDITGTSWSPRLALNLRTFPGQALRVAASRGYRTPVLFENEGDMALDTDFLVTRLTPAVDRINARLALFGQPPVVLPDLAIPMFIGPGDLDPEEVLSREVGYVADFPRHGLSLDLRYYHERLDRLVDTVEVRERNIDYFTFSNEDRASIYGWEANLDWRPTSRSRLWFSYGGATASSNDPRVERSAPDHTAALLGMYRFPRELTASAAYYWISEHAWLGDGNKEQQYIQRLDLRLAKGWRLGGSRVELAGTVQNLGDEYLDFLGERERPSKYNVFDTRALVTLGSQF